METPGADLNSLDFNSTNWHDGVGATSCICVDLGLAVDIREAARRLSLSPRTVATLVARRELVSRKVGRRG